MNAFGWALIAGAVIAVAWLVRQFVTAPVMPEQRSSFDEHAATAAALLQPDAPLLDDMQQLDQLDLMSSVLADLDAPPTTHEREYTQ